MKAGTAHALLIFMKAGTTIVLLVLASLPLVAQEEAPLTPGPAAVELFTGDLDAMDRTRAIRVLVNYSMTNFFVEAGQKRGFEYEMLSEYGKYLNKGAKRGTEIRLVFMPVPFKDILPLLVKGVGDIAAANMTVTSERKNMVDFTDPYLTDVEEVVVAHHQVTGLDHLEDLSGRTVLVRAQCSYFQHLARLNQALIRKGLAPIHIVHPGRVLDTEDVLELVNSGAFDLTVCDKHIAELWAAVFTQYTIRPDLVIHDGGEIAWAVRKNNPQLRAHINGFVKAHKKGTLLGNILFKRYYQTSRWIKNSLTDEQIAKLIKLEKLFRKYGGQYGFDWLLISAQAFQESGLDPRAKSRAGALGIMQLMPSTAKDMGFTHLYDPEDNIHAGVKYMAFLRKQYFSDPDLSEEARTHLILAAYNGGPGRVAKWRKKAAAQGLDPNQWFDHVERVALAEGIRETVVYVDNITKYFTAYQLLYSVKLQKASEKKALRGR